MAEFHRQPETRREPTLPSTNDGKVNVRELTLALGLKRSQEQHFFNHAELSPMGITDCLNNLRLRLLTHCEINGEDPFGGTKG